MDDNFIVSDTPGACWHCGSPTFYTEINFEASLCSDECREAKVREYLLSENRMLLASKISLLGTEAELTDEELEWGYDFINAFIPFMCSEPSLTANGSLQFEWHKNGFNLEISREKIYWYSEQKESELPVAPSQLSSVIQKVSA